MRNGLALLLFGTAVLAACGQDEAQETPRDLAPDTQAVAPADTAAAEVFTDAPARGARLVFVGEDSTVVPDGHPSAVFVPMSTFSVERDGIPNEFPPPDSMSGLLRDAGLGAGDVVIVGEPIPAGRAWAALDYLGLGDRASILDGGPSALDGGAGAASDTTPARVSMEEGGEMETDVRDDMIVDAEWVQERLEDPNVAILDARPPAEFSGETPGEGINRPGHIPGARNVFWQTLVQSESDPRLKDEAELRRIFEEAGAQPGDVVVAYCRTGGQGSFLYAVARHLGYDARLYDGSFIDWSRTEYPVER